jgi:hypothetical protein
MGSVEEYIIVCDVINCSHAWHDAFVTVLFGSISSFRGVCRFFREVKG